MLVELKVRMKVKKLTLSDCIGIAKDNDLLDQNIDIGIEVDETVGGGAGGNLDGAVGGVGRRDGRHDQGSEFN